MPLSVSPRTITRTVATGVNFYDFNLRSIKIENGVITGYYSFAAGTRVVQVDGVDTTVPNWVQTDVPFVAGTFEELASKYPTEMNRIRNSLKTILFAEAQAQGIFPAGAVT